MRVLQDQRNPYTHPQAYMWSTGMIFANNLVRKHVPHTSFDGVRRHELYAVTIANQICWSMAWVSLSVGTDHGYGNMYSTGMRQWYGLGMGIWAQVTLSLAGPGQY